MKVLNNLIRVDYLKLVKFHQEKIIKQARLWGISRKNKSALVILKPKLKRALVKKEVCLNPLIRIVIEAIMIKSNFKNRTVLKSDHSTPILIQATINKTFLN